MRAFCSVVLQGPSQYFLERRVRRVLAALHHRHQVEPVLVASLLGKAADGIGDVLARTFVVAFTHRLNLGEEHDVAECFERGGGIVLEFQVIHERRRS